jgi:hypothetical protein
MQNALLTALPARNTSTPSGLGHATTTPWQMLRQIYTGKLRILLCLIWASTG